MKCGIRDGKGPGCIHEVGHEGRHSNGLRTWMSSKAKKPAKRAESVAGTCSELLRPAGAYNGAVRCSCPTCAVAWTFKQAIRDTHRSIAGDLPDGGDRGDIADAVVNAPFIATRDVRAAWEQLPVEDQIAITKAVL